MTAEDGVLIHRAFPEDDALFLEQHVIRATSQFTNQS